MKKTICWLALCGVIGVLIALPVSAQDGGDARAITAGKLALTADDLPVFIVTTPLDEVANARVDVMNLVICATPDCQQREVRVLGNTGGPTSDPVIALTPEGYPQIGYFHFKDNVLSMLICTDLRCGDPIFAVIDKPEDPTPFQIGRNPALAFTTAGNPVLSYYGYLALRLAVCADPLCETVTTREIDYPLPDGFPVSAQTTALVLDGQDAPRVAYYHGGDDNLKLAVCDALDCANPSIVTVDETPGAGKFAALALTPAGNPIIAYRVGIELRLALCMDALCEQDIKIVTLDTNAITTQRVPLLIGPDGDPVVVYARGEPPHIEMAICNDAACSDPAVVVVDAGPYAGNYYLAAALDSAGNPVIFHYNPAYDDGYQLIRCADPVCESASVTVFGEEIKNAP
ncbi:MAG: hypothetical protein JXJ20_00990 [Anaerolineae bacterium]|nr:hypothetical protein [Anaerolineae bacterium]